MKLFLWPSALRRGALRLSGGCWRSASRAATCSSNARLPGMVKSVNECRPKPIELTLDGQPGAAVPTYSHASCRVSCRKICLQLGRFALKQGNHNSKSHTQKDHAHPGHAAGGEGKDRQLHNPIADRLIPLEPLDLGKVHSIDGLVRAMSKTAFTGRQLGE